MGMVAEAFRMGGFWMYLILAACIVSWPLSFIGLLGGVLSKKSTLALVLGSIVLVIALGTAGLGGIAYMSGISQTEQALEYATPENRDLLRKKGEQLAMYPLYFGLGGSSLPLVLGLITVGAGVMGRDSHSA